MKLRRAYIVSRNSIFFLLTAFILGLVGFHGYTVKVSKDNLALLGEEAPILEQGGVTFRDLNKNGTLDVYEDPRAGIEDRVDNLLSQMTLEEKAATLFIAMIASTEDGKPMETPAYGTNTMNLFMSIILPTNSQLIARKGLSSFNLLNSPGNAFEMAAYHNTLQKWAERTRLGIPITLATDPRHASRNNPGAAVFTDFFSQWPTPLGLSATRDSMLVQEFGQIARSEYLATGFRLALHPVADLATEPRWGRINGTFGEDADLSALMLRAYIRGMQGDSLGAGSVACMTKHFSGGGPQKEGEDPHFPYGKQQVYPGKNFDYHLRPFIEGALPANTAQIMPYYGIPMGQTSEDVAFGFNKDIIQGILRDSLGFDGVVCTDWNIITDSRIGQARAWGVEELSVPERVKKVLDAGCDQFGGESIPEVVVELVRSGQVPEERIDVSVRRILRDKFQLGLFDNPYVDENKAEAITAQDLFMEKGRQAQAKSTVVLKNQNLLPLKRGSKVFLDGIADSDKFEKYGEVVTERESADVVIVFRQSPFEPRNDYYIERFFHQGRLYFNKKEVAEVIDLAAEKPTVFVIDLERPAILTEIDQVVEATVGVFGISDEVLADVLFGNRVPEGQLPFTLPRDWQSVLDQKEDMPFDLENPLYSFGHGLENYRVEAKTDN